MGQDGVLVCLVGHAIQIVEVASRVNREGVVPAMKLLPGLNTWQFGRGVVWVLRNQPGSPSVTLTDWLPTRLRAAVPRPM